MPGILAVQGEDLERLDPQGAVEFFRELLWAEASAVGIGKDLITVPGAITDRDGGVDAEVRGVTVSGGQGISTFRQGQCSGVPRTVMARTGAAGRTAKNT
jgi:hypothetical protein